MAVSLAAQQHAAAAGLGDLQLGTVFYSRGPRPVAREWTEAPGGELLGRLWPGARLVVQAATTHTVGDEWVYVAIKVDSNLRDGYAWVNIQANRD